jgi:hypothetical protein
MTVRVAEEVSAPYPAFSGRREAAEVLARFCGRAPDADAEAGFYRSFPDLDGREVRGILEAASRKNGTST